MKAFIVSAILIITSIATINRIKYGTFVKRSGTCVILSKRVFTSKNPGFVIAIAIRVNGIIFARSVDKFSETYAVALTDATSAAEIKRIVSTSIPSDKTRIKIDRTVNQKKVTIGNKIMNSIMTTMSMM